MAAFARAVELGYRYLETDMRVTADDVLVAFHDDRLDRVTDRPGEIGSLTWREVRAARIGGTDPIPLFADVLASWPDVCVNVDPKSDRAVGPLVHTIRAAGALDRVCIGSFSDRRLRRARAALGPRLCTSMGPGEVLRLRLAAWGLVPRSAVPSGPACAQIPVRRGFVPLAERRMLSWAHELGLPVHVWTVNDPVQMHDLLKLGWTALSAMTSSPYGPCSETAANGIRGERTRLRRWPSKPQALCRDAHQGPVERIPLVPTVGRDLRKRRSAQR